VASVLGIPNDTPPSSLMDSTMSPKVTMKGEGVGACSLTHNTLREEERAGASGWD